MTQEDKELLLKDLCARLPYGVKFKWCDGLHDDYYTFIGINEQYIIGRSTGGYEVLFIIGMEDVKPYLRPMSSMTEEEQRELQSFFPGSFGNQYLDLDEETIELYECDRHLKLDLYDSVQMVDFCKKNHLDCYGLIKRGLAIEVTEENNPYKD